jgi:hypothetical protein
VEQKHIVSVICLGAEQSEPSVHERINHGLLHHGLLHHGCTMNAEDEDENAVKVLQLARRIKAPPLPDLFRCAHNSAFSPRA